MSNKEKEELIEETAPEAVDTPGENDEPDYAKLLEEKEALCNEYLDKYQRSVAEFDNFRKRTIKERDSIAISAASAVVEQLLPVMDNLERAAKLVENSADEAMKQGFDLVARQLTEAFEKIGVTVIETTGCEFDPNLHNAVMHVDDEEVGEGIIVEEFQKGYIYKEKVIRHSMVKVAN